MNADFYKLRIEESYCLVSNICWIESDRDCTVFEIGLPGVEISDFIGATYGIA